MRRYRLINFQQTNYVPLLVGGWSQRFLFLLILFAVPSISMATHEVDHRYVIWGQVLDSQGAAVANTEVRITGFGGAPIGKGVTDANGNYSILLHVHNANNGMKFWVSANGSTREGQVDFVVSDMQTARKHQIDFRPSN